MSKNRAQNFDAVIIGAGPAGTSAATILARAGRRVALLEKEPAPRYRVGESLIPFCWHALDRLGLVDRIAGSGFAVQKNSVQFAGIGGSVSKPFYFFEHTDHPCARTWQVRRAEFDQLLLENALDAGATYFPYTKAESLLCDGRAVVGVRASTKEKGPEPFDLRAPVTIDATGRDSLAQRTFSWRVPDARLRKMSIWTYFEGGLRDSGRDEGTTTIAYLPQKGWFWYIPLPDDRVSVGVVAERDYLFSGSSDLEQIFQREVQVQTWIAQRLAPARRVDELRVTSDFSYRSRHCATDGLVLIGDAFAFLDPVFSSGVYYALTTGVLAADAVLAALAAGDTTAPRFASYGEAVRRQLEPMRRLVYAFYAEDFNFGVFLKRYPELRPDLTDCLIGDLERDYTRFFEAMSDFVEVPAPLDIGGVVED